MASDPRAIDGFWEVRRPNFTQFGCKSGWKGASEAGHAAGSAQSHALSIHKRDLI